MIDSSELERRQKLSFEEAEGLVESPAQFRGDELTHPFRNKVWTLFHAVLTRHEKFNPMGPYSGYSFSDPWPGILFREMLYRRHSPVDEIRVAFGFEERRSQFLQEIKQYILSGKPKLVIGFIQWIVRDKSCPADFIEAMRFLFDSVPQGYSLLGTPPTFIPSVTEEERRALQEALSSINQSKLSGAKSHLAKASQALSSGEARAAIREAIHAVESAASQVAGQPKAVLSEALDALERQRGLHPALKEAFKRLYGYTSDEEGIRHALLEDDNKDVGVDEALFMFSACAAFVSFLARKFPDEDIAS